MGSGGGRSELVVDERVLRAAMGTTALSRGRSYAQGGRVLHWAQENPSRLTGSVQGSGRRPYRVTIDLRRSTSGAVSSFNATCTCPVGHQCKHAAAVLLARTAPAPGPAPAPPVLARPVLARPALSRAASPARPTRPSWQDTVAGILAAPKEDVGAGVGLQFEAVAGPGAASPSGPTGIVLRPVLLGRSGRWVRTGISWSNLSYFRPRPSGEKAEQVIALLEELLAMSQRSGARAYWAPRPESVRLETIKSRRLWDLLEQIRESGGAVVGPGGIPVGLEPPVEVVVDLTRTGRRVQMTGRYTSGGVGIQGPGLLIGSPPHGLAWWSDAGPPGEQVLRVAALGRGVGPAERALVAPSPVSVPAADTSRFLAQVCPRLARRVALQSSDASVALDDLPRLSLMLSVQHRPGHRLTLAWRRGWPNGWSEALWDAADSDPGLEEALGQATALASKLAPLTEAQPGGGEGERLAAEAVLEGMDAVLFVTDLLAQLEQIEGLVVDQSGTPVDYRSAEEAPVVSLGGRASPEGDWFDLAVEVSVGGEAVVFHDLFSALAEGRSHLILPSGTYFSLDSPALVELARLIAEARGLSDSASGQIKLSRFQASLWEDLSSLGILSAQAEAWEASVRALSRAGASEVPVPEGLSAQLRPYQIEGFRWLAFLHQNHLGGILADDMGLGKTLQALALICLARQSAPGGAPFLVVAPTSVVGNWVLEAARFAPGLAAVAVGETSRRRGTALAEATAGADVVVTSYALFRLDYAEYEALEWSGLFLDEAQFAKNSSSHVYRRAKALPVAFKVAITGTPLENNLMELWSLLSITAPGLFARLGAFSEYYRTPIERRGDPERLDQLRRRIRPLMLRRTKDQVASELPEKVEAVLELELHERHRRLYQTYLQRERQKVLGLLGDMEKNRFAIFRSLTLLRQASLDISLVDPERAGVPSTKLDALLPMLEQAVADGHRVLVFSQFTRFLALARQRLRDAGIEHCYLDGRTRRRAEVIADFREGRAPVFLVSLKAGGFGLNLAEADYCILLDPWWNPATEAQAVDRVHRIGQTRKVMVYRMVAKDTIEEKVMALKARKAALFASLFDEGGFDSARLSAQDIRQLLAG
jgi:superfamily II DNA or RNA helicase